VAWIAGGHILLQGVPGMGKTLLAKTFSRAIGGKFSRVQCTADMMPSDITGVHIYKSQSENFEMVPGPVFADVLLVDEINRTGPKTQSALLQAMEERRVSIDRDTYELPENFLVLASQNPYEFEGTYPLPESQLDRFLMRLDLDYQESVVEVQVLKSYDKPGGGHQADTEITAVAADALQQAREECSKVFIDDKVYDYAVAIADASRRHPQSSLGLSTRGVLSLMRCARVQAAIEGRDFVTPDDIKLLAEPVMRHRLQLSPDALLQGLGSDELVAAILQQVEVPQL
jgi:MoxR-like ATPase